MSTSVLEIPQQEVAVMTVKPKSPGKRLAPRLQQLLKEVLSSDLTFVSHPAFELPETEGLIFSGSWDGSPLTFGAVNIPANTDASSVDVLPDETLEEVAVESPAAQAGDPLPSRDMENKLFMRFNFSRMKLAGLVEQFRAKPSRRVAEQIEFWHTRSVKTRELIARMNMPLVLAMAKRSRANGDVENSELVSEGNVALFRAIAKFDLSRGFRFSTYACRAILKAFSRAAIRSSRYRTMFAVELTAHNVDRVDREQQVRQTQEESIVELRRVLSENRAALSRVEQRVIESRFSIDGPADEPDSRMTLEEIGDVIGVTKERVRQIQMRALEKLRFALEKRGVS